MATSSKSRSIAVTVAGERLSLRTDRSEQFITELADVVTADINQICRAAPNIPRHQVFLLVALKLADELYTERENSRTLCRDIASRSDRLLTLVDEELGHLD